MPSSVTRQLFISAVCPSLDYASVIWASQVTSKLQPLLRKIQQTGASAIIGAFRTVALSILESEAGIDSYMRRHEVQRLHFWIDKNSLLPTNPLARISTQRFSRFVSPFQKMAEEYSAIELSKCEVIQPYCIAPWVQKPLVHIPISAETAQTQAKLQQGLTAVLSTSGRQGVLGAGSAIYSPLMPNMAEAGLNTFSVTVLSQKNSNTYATDLFAVNHSLKLMATACKDASVQVYTYNKSVLPKTPSKIWARALSRNI